MDQRVYWIWLQLAIKPGSPLSNQLIERFASPERVYAATAEDYRAIGLSKRQYQCLTDKSLKEAELLFRKTTGMGGWVLTPDDRYFPDGLRQIEAMPLVLYGRGEMPNLNVLPSIAMVGTRTCTKNGVNSAGFIAKGVAKGGAIVVSGGAEGIDAACHAGALDAGGITIAVQACGLDVAYPVKNESLRRQILRRGGAILTEYPLGERPLKTHFRPRNRLMSGMTDGTCVVEAPQRSGALITAHFAREQGKDVFAVPGSIFSYHSAGCNRLIRQGAVLVDDGADIISEYQSRYHGLLNIQAAQSVTMRAVADDGPSTNAAGGTTAKPMPTVEKRPLPAGVTDKAATLYGRLTATPIPVDDLADALGWSTAEVLTVLTELELFGFVENHPGKLYSIK